MPSTPTSLHGGRPRRRVRLAMAIDAAVVVLLVAAAIIAVGGGFRFEVAGARLTARGAERPLLMALALLAVRWWVARGVGAFGSAPGSARRALGRWVRPSADAEPDVEIARPGQAFVLSVAGLVAAGAVLLHAQLGQMDGVPDFGDPLFSMWRIAWVFRQLQGDPRSLFDANIFHPERLTLTLSDAMLLPSLTAAPLLAASLPLVTTYNVVLLSGFLLSGVTAYLLIARLTGSASAAFVGALLYGFHPFRFEHYSHLELQMTHWMPLALLFLHRFVETARWPHAMAAALCLVAQLYSSLYYGVFFPLYAGAVLAVLCAVLRPRATRLLLPLTVATILAVSAAVPLARPYVAAQEVKGERPRSEVAAYSATPADYLRPHHRSALYAGRLLPEVHGERALFPGTTALALSAVGLVPPVGAVRLAYAAGLIVAFDMSTGLNGVLYPPLYEWLMPVRGMRVPARFSIILGISLAVLAAFGVRRLLARCGTSAQRAVALAAIVGLAIVDLRPVLVLERVWPEPPAIHGSIAGRDDVVLAEFPFAIDGAIDSLPQMYFSHWHGRAMVNGYSGFFPPSYQPLLDELEGFPGPAALDALRSRGVTHVSLTCALMPNDCGPMLRAADDTPALRAVAAATWEGQPARLYELRE